MALAVVKGEREDSCSFNKSSRDSVLHSLFYALQYKYVPRRLLAVPYIFTCLWSCGLSFINTTQPLTYHITSILLVLQAYEYALTKYEYALTKCILTLVVGIPFAHQQALHSPLRYNLDAELCARVNC